MATVSPNPFAQRVITKTLYTLPSGSETLFTISGGPIQIQFFSGFVEAEIGGTSYTGFIRASNGTGANNDFSSALPMTGMVQGTMIDFIAPFDVPPTGRPRVENYGFILSYISTGSIVLVPGGTAGSGSVTFSMVYMPMSAQTRVT